MEKYFFVCEISYLYVLMALFDLTHKKRILCNLNMTFLT